MANSTHIAGRNIYINSKNQTIIYDRFTKTGYALRERDKNKLVIYQNRYLITLLVFMLGILMGMKWTTMLGIGALCAILLEYSYRMIFLKSQILMKKFVPGKPKTLPDAIAETATKKTALTHGCMIILLGVLLVYNSFTSQQSSTPLIICSLIACAVCIYYGAAYFRALPSCKEERK